jgi:hypothetical protein
MAIDEASMLKAVVFDLRAKLEQLRRPRDAGEIERMRGHQVRCDGVLAYRGERAPEPNAGESELEYRRRLMAKVAPYSEFKNSRFDSIPSELLSAIEPRAYAQAAEIIRHDAAGREGVLVPVTEHDETGRKITRFVGDPMSWMQHYMSGGTSGSFNRNPKGDR